MSNSPESSNIKNCVKCGKPLEGNTKFCGFCGTRMDEITETKPKKVTALYCKNKVLKTDGDAMLDAVAELLKVVKSEKLLVPFSMTEPDGDININESGDIILKPAIVNSDDGKSYMPVFLHEMQIPAECKETYLILTLDYQKVLNIAGSKSDVSGFVFDPFKEPLCLPYSLIEEAKAFADKRYIIYNKAVGENFPAVDKNGSAWVFTDIESANAVVEKNKSIDFGIREFPKKVFDEYIKVWYSLGIDKFTMDIGSDNSYTVSVGEYLDGKAVSDYAGSKINSLIIRYKQVRTIVPSPAAEDAMNKMRADFCDQLKKSVFIVPINVSDNDAFDDNCFYVSDAAYEIINNIYGGKIEFYGDDSFRLPSGEEVDKMRSCNVEFQHAGSNGKEFVAVFTEFNSLKNVFGADDKLGLFTYNEISDSIISSGEIFDNAVAGLVINPSQTNFVLMRDDLRCIKDMI